MHKGISVIVTVRGDEPFLKPTIENIKAKAGCPVEIIVVYDGTNPDTSISVDQILHLKAARGVGGARHAGIKEAKHSLVFLTDAHMNFSKGFGKIVLDHHNTKGNDKDISCGCCVPTFAGSLTMDHSQRYTGGRFVATSHEPANERWAMSGKWAKQEPGGPIGCIYGACYAFSKAWYKKLGEPLQLLTGWWGDEEYLSAASWMAGGRCVLLDYDAGHLFRNQPSFKTGRNEAVQRALNRARFIDLLPAPEQQKTEMALWLSLNIINNDSDFYAAQEHDRNRPEVRKAAELWAKWDWNKLTPWIDAKEVPIEQRQIESAARRPVSSTVPHTQMRGVFVCPACKNINSFRVRHTRIIGNETRRYGRCGHCGCNGVQAARDNFERIRWAPEVPSLDSF